jgi:hypothetical protein
MKETFEAVATMLHAALPPNWDDIPDWRVVEKVVSEDGLPLAWVPRGRIVNRILASQTQRGRLGVLRAHRQDIVEDCRACLAACHDKAVIGEAQLARKALEALAAEHDSAAQALAVVVTESTIRRFIDKRYEDARKKAQFDRDVSIQLFRTTVAVAPVLRFYTTWYPDQKQPIPKGLSRHVSVHQPTMRHYTRTNALIAVMLMSSLLREVCEWQRLPAR